MKVLVTAGNTLVPIDRVRCITSIFSGRTGAGLAVHAYQRGHDVTLLTSHPETLGDTIPKDDRRWRCLRFRTFDQLATLMEQHIVGKSQEAIIACAAVSDFRPAGVFAAAPGTHFSDADSTWHGDGVLVSRAAGKISSETAELWMRLVRTPKLIDRIRTDWSFRGQLVKFKLEVDVARERLVEIAEQSRRHSQADWMVANLYDGTLSSFFLGPFPSGYEQVPRNALPARLFDLLETSQAQG